MLLLSDHDVRRLLPMRDAIDVMAEALRTLARGAAMLPLRTVLRLPDGPNAFAVMPAYLGEPSVAGAKVITVFPGNESTPYDSHQGIVLLFETEHGRLLAALDASTITGIRTAAVSAVATRLLAREDARDLALLGAGVQAEQHLVAMRCVRPIERVRVWSRGGERATRFASWAKRTLGVDVEPCATAREACDGADLICTVTSSREPVLHGDWIAPGAHVNAVGASLPTARELDSDAIARATLFVDRRESTTNEAGDYLVPLREQRIGPDHIRAELGELLLGAATGRTSRDEITVFKSLGLAIEDLAAARYAHGRALEERAGVDVALGGLRETHDAGH